VPVGSGFLLGLLAFAMAAACASRVQQKDFKTLRDRHGNNEMSDLIGGLDTKDEDIGMDDSTEVSTSLGGEISLGEKKFRESDIGDCDNTGDGSKIAGRAIITWGGEIALYACMDFIYGSSCKGENISMSKRYLVKSFKESGEVFRCEAGKYSGETKV
nr:hypothetical protein [Tanacetum cinerariifolium]